MQLILFSRNDLVPHISRLEQSAENTGFLHVLPNKGGLCSSLAVYGTVLSFISCHLAAHEGTKKCALRNESTEEILGGVRAGDKRFDPSLLSHHTFWMGDMNYRTTFDKTTPADLDGLPNTAAAGGGSVGGIGDSVSGKEQSPPSSPSSKKKNDVNAVEDLDDNEEDFLPGEHNAVRCVCVYICIYICVCICLFGGCTYGVECIFVCGEMWVLFSFI